MSGRRPGWAALMQVGVDSFGAVISDPATGLTLSPAQRLDNLVDEIVLADQVGLDVFGTAASSSIPPQKRTQMDFIDWNCDYDQLDSRRFLRIVLPSPARSRCRSRTRSAGCRHRCQ
jgi:hypothetical protein